MSGPLPEGNRRRANPPTIPTTNLSVSGRKGRPPNPPFGYEFGEAGRKFWRWAWALPQALAWDRAAHYTIARRAELEDDLAALGKFDGNELDGLFASIEVDDPEALADALRALGMIVGRLKALSGGKLAIEKEIRELDRRLGLDPKALAELRWKIVPDTAAAAKKPGAPTGGDVVQMRPRAV